MPDPMDSSRHRANTGDELLRTPARPVKTYRGHQEADGVCAVLVVEELLALGGDLTVGMVRELPLPLEMRAHSPNGFSWGDGGSGPAQLALALLVDALGDRELAQQHCRSFERTCVEKWASAWSITADEIRDFVAREAEGGFLTGDAAADGTSVLAQGQIRFSLGEVCFTAKVAVQIPPGGSESGPGPPCTRRLGRFGGNRSRTKRVPSATRRSIAFRFSHPQRPQILDSYGMGSHGHHGLVYRRILTGHAQARAKSQTLEPIWLKSLKIPG